MPEIDIVLVEPIYEGNVGFAARVMKNFGFHRLVLINPCKLGNEADARASHAWDVLHNAEVCTIEDVFARSNLVIAATGTVSKSVCRAMRMPFYSPKEIRERIKDTEGRISILFGRENWGLNNEEVKRSDLICTIPTAEDTRSSTSRMRLVSCAMNSLTCRCPASLSVLRMIWHTCSSILTGTWMRFIIPSSSGRIP